MQMHAAELPLTGHQHHRFRAYLNVSECLAGEYIGIRFIDGDHWHLFFYRASSTERTLFTSVSGVNGFSRKAASHASTP